MIGLIVSGGDLKDNNLLVKYYNKSNFCIAVDKGVEFLLENNLNYDLALGDFDSIDIHYFEKVISSEKEYIKYEVEKDKSDTEIAVDYLINMNCKTIYIIAATGDRLDHTVTNIMLLKKMKDNNIEALIIDKNNRVRFGNKENLINNEYPNVSIVPVSLEGAIISLSGFYYLLVNSKLEFGSSKGLSNYLVGNNGYIYIHSGLALIIESRD